MFRVDRLGKHFLQPRSATGLALFRITYSLTLLFEVLQLFSVRRLVFDAMPFLEVGTLYLRPAFALWVIAIICLMFGLFTRQAIVVNYVMTLLTFSTSRDWEYHVDYIYTGIGLFLLLVPVERTLSIDAWWARRQAAIDQLPPPATTVPRIHYDALILVGIAIVYLDSIFYKLASPMWLSGLGLWRPASLPHNTFWNIGWLLDLKFLMIALGYLTLAFEATFIAAMWFDRLRPILFLIGFGLHRGIVITFPIPLFGLAVAALYALLVPDEWWQGLARRFSRTSSTAPSSSSASSVQQSIAMTQADRSERRLAAIVATLACVTTAMQLLQTSRADLTGEIAAKTGLSVLRQSVVEFALQAAPVSRIVLGVTPHPVFMDFHFDDYEAFYTLVHVNPDGRQTWLPMSNESGQGTLIWSGRLWVNWTWRVSNPLPDRTQMSDGLRRITAWWIGKRGFDFNGQRFLVMRRNCDPCDGWRLGYYQDQLEHEWLPIGTVEWTDGQCEVMLEPDALTRSLVATSVAKPSVPEQADGL